ncbi:unnamed protein product [Toxocara canis]|uniref:Protein tweety homolog n=1 Tax=Toxocara canis TaxID=6265 RepID=A0A183UWT7_TOXCA|nr:unnamed protein product [Toxocara canis]
MLLVYEEEIGELAAFVTNRGRHSWMMKHGGVIVIVGAIATLIAGRVECVNDITKGCSSLCTLAFDKDLQCWNRTLAYFTKVMLGVMKQYVSTQETLARMEKFKPSNVEDEEGIVDEELMTVVAEILVHAAMKAAADNFLLIAGQCPYGCEERWDRWLWLTIVSLFCSVILASTIIFFIFLMDRADKSEKETESVEARLDRKTGVSHMCSSVLEAHIRSFSLF